MIKHLFLKNAFDKHILFIKQKVIEHLFMKLHLINIFCPSNNGHQTFIYKKRVYPIWNSNLIDISQSDVNETNRI